MANEVIIKSGDLVSLTENNDLSSLIKPLTKEIHLLDSFISGTTHLPDPSVLEDIKTGDKLTLVREANPFDNNAVLIRTEDRKKLGYIPQKDNIVFARLMDAGKLLTAKITEIEKRNRFYQIRIGIYLVDF